MKLKILQGADPNGGHHEHNYTSLHFAALSGNGDVCVQLLQNGVKTDATNSVNRTATQMAAFVGEYEQVTLLDPQIFSILILFYPNQVTIIVYQL